MDNHSMDNHQPHHHLKAAIGFMIALALLASAEAQQPRAPHTMDNVTLYGANVSFGGLANTSGGSITVMNLNVTYQNPRWKAYVGNISGKLALIDAQNKSLYDWTVSTPEGELYATRNDSMISWDAITCANYTNIFDEEAAINFSHGWTDSINATFNRTVHRQFYAGNVLITGNSCPSTTLNVNDTAQDEYFQELVLNDGSHIVYSTLIEQGVPGFNNLTYDYQMILPDSGLEDTSVTIPYYFYVELI